MRGKGFTFKQFHIDHSRCAMKVGTDGTLIGAWASLPPSARHILDIGTGSGLIAIMAAQRHQQAHISAIDIDSECIAQAQDNVEACPWSNRIELHHCALQDFQPEHLFNVIISNPPYFVDSLLSPDEKRSTARHTSSLSFDELVEGVMRLMAADGHFALILPPAECEKFLSAARGKLYITRRCEVWSTPTSGVKRVMVELQATPPAEPATTDKIIIEEHGVMGYGEKYKLLTKDFYLKF